MFRILILTFFNFSTIFAQNIDDLFNEGNLFYSQNQYDESIIKYEQILEKGYFSEDLYLNLGNAYFQDSSFGSARWSFEMGLKLNPFNSDLKNNNNVNKTYIENYIELPKNNIIDVINIFFQSFSINQFVLFNSITIFLSALSFFLMKIFQIRIFRKLFSSMSIIMTISILITFTKNLWDQNNKFAIIIEEKTVMYSAPFLNQAIENSVFYSGNKVKIHQNTESWIEVSAFDGRKGWIRAIDVRNLN